MLFHYKKQLISLPLTLFSKPLKPSTTSNKPLPYIKVIEIKSWSGCAGEELLTRRRQNHQTFSMQTENKHRVWQRENISDVRAVLTASTLPLTCLNHKHSWRNLCGVLQHTRTHTRKHTHTHPDACCVSALASIHKVYWFSRFEVLHVWYCTQAFPRPALFWLLC